MSAARGIAIVTGAASGIGRSCVARFVEAGLQVAAIDLSEEKLAAVLQESAGRAHAFACDLSDFGSMKEIVPSILRTLGPVSVLVNNAGAYLSKPIHETTAEDWHRALNLNLVAPALLTAAVVPGMRQRGGGAIVNVSSRNALMSTPGASTYDASKAGLLALTRCLAMELGPDNIRVNAVCPGVTKTSMTAAFFDREDFVNNYRRLIPLGRFGEPDDIGHAIAFLCSEAARFITGQHLVIDGGQGCGQDFNRIFGPQGLPGRER